MKFVSAAFLLLVFVSRVDAQDRVIGLLSLPELFGTAACERFKPEDIRVFATPDSATPVGILRVDQYWTFHAVGGCEGLQVNAHRADDSSAERFPTLEYEYEAPGAVVLAQQGRWFKVRLPKGSAWLRASDRAEFHSFEALIVDGLAYLTEVAGGRLVATPGAAAAAESPAANPGSSVKVVEVRRLDGEYWVHVEVMNDSPCLSVEEPRVVHRGWLRAHDASGEPTVWFYSRGC